MEWFDIPDDNGETPLDRAVRCSDGPTREFVLKLANQTHESGLTPGIHRAARESDVQMVREMLDAGMDASEADPWGMTPLHWASTTGCLDLAKLLLNRGADPNAREYKAGLTPLSLARNLGYDDLVTILSGRGATV